MGCVKLASIENNSQILNGHRVDVVLVEFSDYTGRVFFPDHPTLVPIFMAKATKGAGTRWAFPIQHSAAVPVHKCQRMSLYRVWIDLGNQEFVPGLCFVALSRCKSIEGISMKTFPKSRLLNLNRMNMGRLLKFWLEADL